MVNDMRLPRVTRTTDGAYRLREQTRNQPFRCSSHVRKIAIKKLRRMRLTD